MPARWWPVRRPARHGRDGSLDARRLSCGGRRAVVPASAGRRRSRRSPTARHHPGGRQDLRPGQRLRCGGQAPRLRAGRHRHDCRARRRSSSSPDPGPIPPRRRATSSPRPSTTSVRCRCCSRRRRRSRRRCERRGAAAAPGPPAARDREPLDRGARRAHGDARRGGGGPPRRRLRARAPRAAAPGRRALGEAHRPRRRRVRRARSTPEAVGDYVAGPSHVLPTAGTARFASPLSVATFRRRMSVLDLSPAALAAVAPGGGGARRGGGVRGARAGRAHCGSAVRGSPPPAPPARGRGGGASRRRAATKRKVAR